MTYLKRVQDGKYDAILRKFRPEVDNMNDEQKFFELLLLKWFLTEVSKPCDGTERPNSKPSKFHHHI